MGQEAKRKIGHFCLASVICRIYEGKYGQVYSDAKIQISFLTAAHQHRFAEHRQARDYLA